MWAKKERGMAPKIAVLGAQRKHASMTSTIHPGNLELKQVHTCWMRLSLMSENVVFCGTVVAP